MTAFAPRHYPGVMVSSTFQDFVAHREVLIRVIAGQGLHPVAMEQDSARPAGTVIDSSLEKVRDAAAYVGIIGHRYGNVPDSATHNPDGLSLTEMEFREARRLGRPILLFVMGPDHEVKPSAVEIDAAKLAKLEAFRENAKRVDPNSSVHRIYKVFNSLGEFEVAATQSVAELRRLLDTPPAVVRPADGIPTPPVLYAEPHYIGSHTFVGRAAQLETLTDWASPADPHPVLLFEAIGGSGKSMLTWEWTTRHAPNARLDWAGRFWYSFYEKGAVMADFCRRALAYMTGEPFDALVRMRQRELTDGLVRQLRAKPWLVILDGLERVLVAYHRYDAAQLLDEEAGRTDEIAERHPCATIRPEDEDLLRLLAGTGPSKVLITSRLVPRVLLNAANQAIPGVLHEPLPGLRPADAEALLRTCGVRGESERMQDYLRRHCDCHPLVTGVVAGLVNDYLPNRGDFDAWAADPDRGGQLDLANLDLVQKRNDILTTAFDSLSATSRQLLSTLALLPEAADYPTLEALSPHGAALAITVRDLEQRGLLQYDRATGRYDLHPVVRAVASGGLPDADRDRLGQRVVDHFSARRSHSFDLAETLDDLRAPLMVVRTLLRMRKFREASTAFSYDLSNALLFNLEAYAESLSLMRPFFGPTWVSRRPELNDDQFADLASRVARALQLASESEIVFEIYETTITAKLASGSWLNASADLMNIGIAYESANRLGMARRCLELALRFREAIGQPGPIFSARLNVYELATLTGRWNDAEALWRSLAPMGRAWDRWTYRPGDAELSHAAFQYRRGGLEEAHLSVVQQLAREGRNRSGMRLLHNLRGRWLLDQGNYEAAAESLREALRMERETTLSGPDSEAWLALALVHLGQRKTAREIAERRPTERRPPHLPLSELWHALGDPERARTHALEAYKWAWADGEPHVRRFELDRSAALLRRLGAAPPALPGYNPARDPEIALEGEVAKAIEELRRQRWPGT